MVGFHAGVISAGSTKYGQAQSRETSIRRSRVGRPDLPTLNGKLSLARLRRTHDSQDNPIVPSRGVHAATELRPYLSAPTPSVETDRSADGVTQFETLLSWA